MITPITPPRSAERLLESLGAEPEFRDALLGDLTEEFAIRAVHDGDVTARRWYWRAAIRVAPHLMRSWAGRLRLLDIARLAGVVSAAYFLVGTAVGATLFTVEAVVERMGSPTTFPWHDLHPGGLALGVMLLGNVSVAAVGGWLASRLETRAPAVAALGLGLVWAAIALLAPLPARASLPVWYLVGQAVAVLISTTLGGMLRIATHLPHSRA